MIFLDLETRSRADIRSVGGHRYVTDPSTELICGVVGHLYGGKLRVVPYGPSQAIESMRDVWRCKAETLELLRLHPSEVVWGEPLRTDAWLPEWAEQLANHGATLVAHNAEGFDRPALEHHGLDLGCHWIDSAHRARQSGLPAGLDAVGQSLFGLGKSRQAVATLRRFISPVKKTGEFRRLTSGALMSIVRYCARDVLLMYAAWKAEHWSSPHPDDAVREVHVAMDRRGLPADVELAQTLYDQSLRLRDVSLQRAADIGVEADVIASVQKLKAYMHEQGYVVPNAQKGTLQAALADDTLPDSCRVVIEARLACSRVTIGKALKALQTVCPDGRMRGTTVYWGAHTGRWSGRNYQVQNLPSPVKGFEEGVYSKLVQNRFDAGVPAVAQQLKVAEEDVLSSMLRGVIVAEPGRLLAMEDYSQIEARVLPWLAGDEETLQVFRDGKDIYRAAGAKIYGIGYDEVGKGSLQRKVGKVATLALGYQGGPGALLAMAEMMQLDLEEQGIDPAAVVTAWRDANPLIAGTAGEVFNIDGREIQGREGGLWKDVQRAAWLAVRGQRSNAARCVFRKRDQHLEVVLPSGRPLVYRNAAIEQQKDNWGKIKPCLVFDAVRYGKVQRESTYGGRLVENITQAVARDVMAHAMILLEAGGLRPMFTVHDEIICSIERAEDEQRVIDIMETVPAWARHLPLKASGMVGERYAK